LTFPDRSVALELRGKVAIVTGGGRGLGRALVESLARSGADVAFSHRESAAGAAEVVRAVEALGCRAFTLRADAREPGEIPGFVEAAGRALGAIDVLVNNVGSFRKTPFGTLSEDALDEAFDVNVKAAVLAAQAAAPHIRRRGGGAIVNVASLGGLRAWRSYLPYCASKAALIMATRCLALALAPEIRVNAVAPGILDPPGADDAIRRRVPMKRFGAHAEAVAAVLFLAAGGSYTTGAVLPVDGGRELY
jgi:NAD(P)-dependent dehydrogenase (short-subunit alcohol dehydrogenase family)